MKNTSGEQTLLCVDDDEDSLALIRHILKHRPNITLLTSTDALSGLDLAKSQRPDLIILDINQPQMDGYAILKHLQNNENTRNIPVIACSAYATQEDIKKGLDAGLIRYLVKPLKASGFLELIDAVLVDKQ